MQPKINSFFKPPPPPPSSSPVQSSNSPPVLSDGENDDLAIWEKTQHTFVNTYTRRSQIHGNDAEKESSDKRLEKPIPENESSREESGLRGKNLGKKRSYAQFHLELGQSDFLLRTCLICGLKYSPGDEEDEKGHSKFHKNFTLGIKFKGWKNERVVHIPEVEGSRIIMVSDADPVTHRNKVREVLNMMEIELGEGWIYNKLCKVYLFVCSQRIVGCLVAEPINEAFKVLPCSVGERQAGAAAAKQTKSKSSKLQFGELVLQREVVKRGTSKKSSENHTGAVLCEKEPVSAACGIRAIWVTPSNRRIGIATQLLEAVRKSFCMSFVIEKSQLAFSNPSADGQALASNYIGTASFLVYK
ncbi:Acyl-CoA N-acyltransferase [Corchorus capsularis]|uniref:Acyl-CoA N-acyltransferase n=1 Tax=Corchorus capsularis TaxID=210143 RepID=A0A1R3IJ59_COCAP|nr:Acyl-CoA N-acyltransferase [Corchorus capsularis]